MIKKLYSLFSILLLLASCTTEEMEQMNNQSGDESKITLSFSVDAPEAIEITKAVGNTEKGVESLYLYTFNADGDFIAPVVEATVSGSGYTALISKETRTIHFVANESSLIPSKENMMASLTTNKQIFWGKRTFTTVPAKDLSNNQEESGNNIELLRNWAKITLNLSNEATLKLKEVSYLIYNESQLATIGYNESGKLNVPNQSFYAPGSEPETSKFAQPGTSIYTFEHSNQNDKEAFVIVKAKFDGSSDFTYYKIDLAVKDEHDQVTRVYDLVRNYAFNITVKSVSRKGLTWSEVIDKNTIADNNITASAIMEKYPNITYDGEVLNVTKTTFVFTGTSSQLSMTATYKGKGQLSVVPDEGLSDVVKGDLNYPSYIPKGDQTITITADIKSAPTSGEKVAYFYVVGGNLQRKIKLVLRPPYNFIDPRLVDANESSEITSGQKQDVYLKFSIPEEVDESLYPIEYKIYTKKLYAVEEGVRLETTGSGEWYYVYTDQIPSTAERVIHFKTNTKNEGESDVVLDADLFNAVNDLTYTRNAPRSITGTIKFGSGNNTVNIRQGETVTYNYGSQSGTIKVGSNGTYSLEVPKNYSGDIIFSYTTNGLTFTGQGTVGAQSSLDVTLTIKDWNVISGEMTYEGSYGDGEIDIPESATVTSNNNNVKVIIVAEGSYSLFYKSTFGTNTEFKLTYDPGSNWADRTKKTKISTLKSDSKIKLER